MREYAYDCGSHCHVAICLGKKILIFLFQKREKRREKAFTLKNTRGKTPTIVNPNVEIGIHNAQKGTHGVATRKECIIARAIPQQRILRCRIVATASRGERNK